MSVKIIMPTTAIDYGFAVAKKKWYEFRRWMFW
jgi:hypothetical protein